MEERKVDRWSKQMAEIQRPFCSHFAAIQLPNCATSASEYLSQWLDRVNDSNWWFERQVGSQWVGLFFVRDLKTPLGWHLCLELKWRFVLTLWCWALAHTSLTTTQAGSGAAWPLATVFSQGGDISRIIDLLARKWKYGDLCLSLYWLLLRGFKSRSTRFWVYLLVDLGKRAQ